MKKLGVVGAGKMATAILDGALSAGYLSAEQVIAYDVSEASQDSMAQRGICAAKTLGELADCPYVLLSVKPQIAPAVLPELGKLLPAGCTVISIAAGITPAAIAEQMSRAAVPVVQVMPNTPIMVGMGATALCRTAEVPDDSFAFAKGLFAAAGVVEEIAPDRMNEIIAVHGSTPAYIYLIARYFCEYAAEQGIAAETANKLFCQTLAGAAKMMTETGLGHQQLIDMVTSPGGTTLAGLQSLSSSDLKKTIFDCCDATVRRAYELGKG